MSSPGPSVAGPLPSATYAGAYKPYYAPRNAGGQLVGVESLNGLIGLVAVAGDTSIGVTKPGLGVIQVSTAGLPQVPSSVTATGAIVGATVTATGNIAGSGCAISGGLTAGSATVTTSVNCASLVNSSGVTTTGGQIQTAKSFTVTAVGGFPIPLTEFPIQQKCIVFFWAQSTNGNYTSGSLLVTSTPGGIWGYQTAFSSGGNGITTNYVGNLTTTGITVEIIPSTTSDCSIGYFIQSMG